jgi:hypothetical protein
MVVGGIGRMEVLNHAQATRAQISKFGCEMARNAMAYLQGIRVGISGVARATPTPARERRHYARS